MISEQRGRFTYRIDFDSGHKAVVNQFHMKPFLDETVEAGEANELVETVWDAYGCAERHPVRDVTVGLREPDHEVESENTYSGLGATNGQYFLRSRAIDPACYKD